MATKHDSYVVILITAPDKEEAELVAGVLLEQNKAACVNIVPEVNSLFKRKRRIKQSTESLLIVKTHASLLNDITKLIKELHSYDNPEIIALPIIGGSQDYVNWIFDETEVA